MLLDRGQLTPTREFAGVAVRPEAGDAGDVILLF